MAPPFLQALLPTHHPSALSGKSNGALCTCSESHPSSLTSLLKKESPGSGSNQGVSLHTVTCGKVSRLLGLRIVALHPFAFVSPWKQQREPKWGGAVSGWQKSRPLWACVAWLSFAPILRGGEWIPVALRRFRPGAPPGIRRVFAALALNLGWANLRGPPKSVRERGQYYWGDSIKEGPNCKKYLQ